VDAPTKNLLVFMVLVSVSIYICMFILDPTYSFVYIYLKILSVGLVPGAICFGWLYVWRGHADPFNYLGLWNSGTQILFLFMNLFRVQFSSWGVVEWLYIALSFIIVGFYVTKYHETKWGFFISGGLIPLNVVFAFIIVLTTFESQLTFFSQSNTQGILALSNFLAEMSVMGAVYTSSAQLYWHDILTKRREQALVESIFSSLEAREQREV
jgi:hypothetical protein